MFNNKFAALIIGLMMLFLLAACGGEVSDINMDKVSTTGGVTFNVQEMSYTMPTGSEVSFGDQCLTVTTPDGTISATNISFTATTTATLTLDPLENKGDLQMSSEYCVIEEPTSEPAEEPTEEPVEEPTPEPAEEPTEEPVEEPTPEPAAEIIDFVLAHGATFPDYIVGDRDYRELSVSDIYQVLVDEYGYSDTDQLIIAHSDQVREHQEATLPAGTYDTGKAIIAVGEIPNLKPDKGFMIVSNNVYAPPNGINGQPLEVFVP